MNIPEPIITVVATVLGSVAIAYTTLHLQAKQRKRTLLRALLGEIKVNYLLAQHLKADNVKTLKRYPSLHTEAYQNLRLVGDPLALPEADRRRLEYTYEMVNTHNDQIRLGKIDPPYGVHFVERNDEILSNLKLLENELPKYIPKKWLIP